jgi:2-polyprenyl-6-methoxyphenol hydroxylase-like FAD-dependent oxidoreductase
MSRQSVLIVGAGIAGLSLAAWLTRAGHEVRLVERAKALGSRGHMMSLKGTAVQAARALGIEEALRAKAASGRATLHVASSGRVLRETAQSERAETLGGLIMLRRSDLHAELLGLLPSGVRIDLNDTVASLTQDAEGVDVKLAGGEDARFDLVVGADGVHSKLRGLAFPELRPEFLHGHYFAMFLRPGVEFDHTRNAMVVGKGRDLNWVPYSPTELCLIVYQDDKTLAPPVGESTPDWRAYFTAAYRDFPRQYTRAFDWIGSNDDVFFDEIWLVPVGEFARGRIALVGDAAYCPTFFSGMGGAAAIQGAYCLARRLSEADDVPQALMDYQRRFAPLVAGYQASARDMRDRLLARGGWREKLRDLAMTFMSRKMFESRARQFYFADVSLEQY